MSLLPLADKRINRRAIPYWRSLGCIYAVIYLLIPSAYGTLSVIKDWPVWPIPLLVLLALGLSLLSIVWLPVWRWKRWRYRVTEHEIALSRGILIRTGTLIPMIKVQHVDSEQGPLMRRFQLSGVSISTAGGSHEIPALDDQEAIDLRNRIAELARVVDEDV